MNLRKIASMTLVWSIIILTVNSIVLYVVPEGRVAYWADWSFFGLSKSDWGAQHITIGVLFLLAGLVHIFYNWKPIMNYLKNRAKEFQFFSGANVVALGLTLFFGVGTYFNLPPMAQILSLSDHFKEVAGEKYGEPPYGHAELSSLKMFTKRDSLDLAKSMELLQAAGVEVKSESETLKTIAARAGVPPQHIYDIIKSAGDRKASPKIETMHTDASSSGSQIEDFVNGPKSGLGKMTLESICSDYGISLEMIQKGLTAKGINAEPSLKLKEIADANDTTPMGLYEILVEIVTEK
jgi:hypothetical protein